MYQQQLCIIGHSYSMPLSLIIDRLINTAVPHTTALNAASAGAIVTVTWWSTNPSVLCEPACYDSIKA